MTITTPGSPSGGGSDADRHRLPAAVRPRHYDIELDVDLTGARFDGFVTCRVDVAEPTDRVVLNAAELDVTSAWVTTGDDTRHDATIRLDVDTERVELALGEPLPPGPATLHVRFAGVLNDKLVGFYRTTFTDPDGNEVTAAATQFEATHARKAFPCWDEPAFKATFGVTLTVPGDQLAISNGAEVERTTLDDGRARFRFAPTMVMSTYLVAFVVGPFEATAPTDVEGTPLRVVYPRGQGHLTDYALEAGAFGLRFFADYYGIGYPGDKVDLVAVPDFAFGAMENLGCITFREVLLLVDPATVTQPELQRVADVIFHELAHMWFGDLVTMRWWNGLWLNEAFATFMEMKCTDAFRPAWERWVDFGLSRTAAFDTDALASTRPIEYEVVSPADAEGMFDILTYEKGAAVLRMVEQYLGEDAFRDGVRRYLNDNAYGNTETTDLWDAIEAETGQPVRQVADSWIFQGGFPLITARLDAGGALSLAQEPFRYLPGEGAEERSRWSVPVILRTDAREQRVLLEGPTAGVTVDTDPAYVLVNAGGHGFYRVRYLGDLQRRLAGRAHDHLANIERYALVDDTMAAVMAGQTPASSFLELARDLAHDDDLSVWQRLASALGVFNRVVDDDDRDHLATFLRDLAGPALDITGWEAASGESDRQRELRAALFTLLGTTGQDPKVHEWARRTHADASENPDSVDPSLAAAAVNVLANVGDADTYERFLTRAENPAANPQEHRRYLYAAADFRPDPLMDRTLERCRNGEIRTQDAPYIIGRALTNRVQGPRVWRFVAARWDELNDRFPSNTIVRMLSGITTFTDADLAADVNAFFAEHDVPQGAKTLAQHLEKMAVMVALTERERPGLGGALS